MNNINITCPCCNQQLFVTLFPDGDVFGVVPVTPLAGDDVRIATPPPRPAEKVTVKFVEGVKRKPRINIDD